VSGLTTTKESYRAMSDAENERCFNNVFGQLQEEEYRKKNGTLSIEDKIRLMRLAIFKTTGWDELVMNTLQNASVIQSLRADDTGDININESSSSFDVDAELQQFEQRHHLQMVDARRSDRCQARHCAAVDEMQLRRTPLQCVQAQIGFRSLSLCRPH